MSGVFSLRLVQSVLNPVGDIFLIDTAGWALRLGLAETPAAEWSLRPDPRAGAERGSVGGRLYRGEEV